MLSAVFALTNAALAQFSPVVLNPEVSGMAGHSAAWGDYDGDADLDLVISGHDPEGQLAARVLRQDAPGTFVDAGDAVIGLTNSATVWADYDNDGDVDFLLSGSIEIIDPIPETIPVTRIYRNDAGVFVDVDVTMEAVTHSSADWGDYDNDGDLDLLLLGKDSTFASVSFVYRNDGGSFTDAAVGLEALSEASGAWGDYDNDGDLDILLTGWGAAGPSSRIYVNDGGSFFTAGAGLVGVSSGDAAWGDYDADGDLDIVLTGIDSMYMNASLVYRNDGGTFVDIGAGLEGVSESAVQWGDYDNDGDLDLLLTGLGTSGLVARVYRNDLGSFVDSGFPLEGVSPGAVAWGDYDGDGKLDFLLTGVRGSGDRVTSLYRNVGSVANTTPATPTGLSVTWAGLTGTFGWSAASDPETPAAGLTYNLRVGTTPGGSEISSAMSDSATGLRFVPEPGNTGSRTTWSIAMRAGADVYWSVQAVDGAFAASGFAPEQQTSVATFSSVGVGVTPLRDSVAEWGDFDGDGDLDLLSAGSTLSGPVARVHRNDSGVLTDIFAGLVGMYQGSADWADYDNDGDLDILLTGLHETRLYRNDSGSFLEVPVSLPGLAQSAAAWGDCDNDGDLDLVLLGYDFSQVPVSSIHRNDAGAFVDLNAGLEPVGLPAAGWCDIDADGDLDLALAGAGGMGPITRIYENTAGTFLDRGDVLEGLSGASMDFGDFDGDGDSDLLLSGLNAVYETRSIIYRNDAGWFTDIGAQLPGVAYGSSRWGDYDNDGDLDVLLAGAYSGGGRALVYRNDSGVFTDAGAGLVGITGGSAAWGEFDEDSDLDIVLTGSDEMGNPYFEVYRNLSPVPNQRPGVPAGLIATTDGSTITFSWEPATDAQTPGPGLTYNLRVGTTPGGHEVLSAMAGVVGDLYLARDGNVRHATEWTLDIPPGQTYYWSVQAVDSGFEASDFAPEASTGTPRFADVGAGLTSVTQASIAWGDYDQDDDLDLVVTGDATGAPYTQLYRNDGGAFTAISTSITDIRRGSIAWGDYDGDGDLDLLLAGESGAGPITAVYRNDVGAFVGIDPGVPDLIDASVAWGDSDNDGDLDFVLTGSTGLGDRFTQHYGNDGGVFTPYGTLVPVRMGSVAWGDHDGNGFRDLLVTGMPEGGTAMWTRVYRNSGGGFTEAGYGMEGVWYGSAAWSDYDNDGLLDVLIAGRSGSWDPVTRIYHRVGGSFVDSGASLLGVDETHSGGWWGDLDNDGLRDVLTLGRIGSAEKTHMYRNDGSDFVRVPSGIQGFSGVAALADYDGDGDLDVATAGTRSGPNPGPAVEVFRNDTATWNSPPQPPGDLSESHVATSPYDHQIRLSWGSGADGNTSADGLTYNVGVRAMESGAQVVAAMSNEITGFRLVPQNGNADHNREFVLTLEELGHYSWSVQSVDASMIGSPFAPQRGFWLQPWRAVTTGPLGDTGYEVSAAWADFDLDGDLDVYLANRLGSQANRLLRNDDPGQASFVDVTVPPLDYDGRCRDAIWGDYDNDGDPDLYLVNDGPNKLLRNDGGAFTEIVDSGLENGSQDGQNAAWIDYDGDGLIDLGLTNASATSRLYENQGDGTFLPGWSFTSDVGMAWGDYDGDGDPDGYALNAAGGNILYRNDGIYLARVTPEPLANVGPATAATWGDYDNDEDLDLYVVVTGGANALFRNDGGDTFTEVTEGVLGDPGDGRWAAWGDGDNDGDLDLYLINQAQQNRMLINEGDGSFGVGLGDGLGDEGWGACAPWGDFDDDGDLDLYLVNDGQANVLLRNSDASSNSWLKVDLTGIWSHPSGVGARVRIVVAGTAQIRDVTAGTGIGGQGPTTVSFGLGAASVVDSVQVRWPSGSVQEVADVAVNQRLELVEPHPGGGPRVWNVPLDAPTIQAGIDLAAVGDTVRVACGTYHENVVLEAGIVLTSETGQPDCVTIDGDGSPVLTGLSIGDATEVTGFTITDGGGTTTGAGMRLEGSSPTIERCRFSGNRAAASGQGGGMYLLDASPSLVDCEFLSNDAAEGSALYMAGASSPALLRCTFMANTGSWTSSGALHCASSTSPSLTECILANQRSAALYAVGATVTMERCTIFDNQWGFQIENDASLTADATIVAFNRYASHCHATATVTFSCCDFFGNKTGDTGGCLTGQIGVNGNFSADPEFCDPRGFDLHVAATSPCLSAPGCSVVGALGEGCPVPPPPRVWHIPGDRPTIRSGFTACWVGDTLEVASGTYYEHALTMPWSVVLRSAAGDPDSVTIDAEGLGQVLSVDSVDTTAVVSGITLANGSWLYGAGIQASGSDLTVERCVFLNNHSTTGGAGIRAEGAGDRIVIRDCTFLGNASDALGVVTVTSAASLENTIIAFSTAGPAVVGNPTLSCCDIYGNAGGDWVGDIAGQLGTNGNFSADPLFCDAAGGDAHVGYESPCVHAEGCGMVGAVGPACGLIINAIEDVPADQGGQVSVRWARAVQDALPPGTVITDYALWRRIDGVARVPEIVSGSIAEVIESEKPLDGREFPPGEWEVVMTVPASGEDEYMTVSPTLCDSTVASGMCWSTFFVRASTDDPLTYFDSAPDSGYSVDNLAPSVPENLTVALSGDAGDVQLDWSVSPAPDFQHFILYRGTDPDFIPDAGSRIAYLIEPTFLDPLAAPTGGGAVYYKLSAADLAGNESDVAFIGIAAAETPEGTGVVVDFGGGIVVTFDEVTAAGRTEVVIGAPGPVLPGGYLPGADPALVIDISTDATFSDLVEVCVIYDETELTGPEDELVLLHYEEGLSNWTDITTLRDPVADRICGETPTLSPFGLARLTDVIAAPAAGSTPTAVALYRARPNPFNPHTVIAFDLPEPAAVGLRVYDAAGRLVRTLIDSGARPSGRHEVSWFGRDDSGRPVGSGVYYYELTTPGFEARRRVVLLR